MSVLRLLSGCQSWCNSAPMCSNEYAGLTEDDKQNVNDSNDNWLGRHVTERTPLIKHVRTGTNRTKIKAAVEQNANKNTNDARASTASSKNTNDARTSTTTSGPSMQQPSTSGESKHSNSLTEKVKKSMSKSKKKQTLLDLAKCNQMLKPDRRESRETEREQDEETELTTKLNIFLDWYYKRQEQISQEKKKKVPCVCEWFIH